MVVVLGGAFAIFFATLGTWPGFVVLAAVLAYEEAATRLYKWKWDDWPGRTRSGYVRSVALLIPVMIGAGLVFWFTPGGIVVKTAVYAVYAAALIALLLLARRVTTWEWLD